MPVRTQSKLIRTPSARFKELSAELLKVAVGMDPEVTSKDAHKLRTSIRRIEVALEPAGKFAGAKKLQKQMDAMRRMAGQVRDLDVQTELLEKLRNHDYSADCEALHNWMLKRREKREKKVSARVQRELNNGLEDRLMEGAKA